VPRTPEDTMRVEGKRSHVIVARRAVRWRHGAWLPRRQHQLLQDQVLDGGRQPSRLQPGEHDRGLVHRAHPGGRHRQLASAERQPLRPEGRPLGGPGELSLWRTALGTVADLALDPRRGNGGPD